MTKPVIWMFSGQGSQYYQMGGELFEHEPVFRQSFERGSAIVKDLVNESLVDIVYRPRPNRYESFHRTLLTTPAILVVEYAMAQLIVSKGAKPDRLLGYSIGEFASFVLAGVLEFEETLTAVVKPRGAHGVLHSPHDRIRHPGLCRGHAGTGGGFSRLRNYFPGFRQRDSGGLPRRNGSSPPYCVEIKGDQFHGFAHRPWFPFAMDGRSGTAL